MKVQLNDQLMEKINGGVDASPTLADVNLSVPAGTGFLNVTLKGPGQIAAIDAGDGGGEGVGEEGIQQAV